MMQRVRKSRGRAAILTGAARRDVEDGCMKGNEAMTQVSWCCSLTLA